MTKFKAISAAVLGASLLMAPPVVQAAPVSGSAMLGVANSTEASPLVEVRHRGRRHWRGHRYYHRHNDGAALAAGAIFGLAAGAIAANAAGNNAVAYCSQRYRSYDPGSGTYLGYDGYRHPCP